MAVELPLAMASLAWLASALGFAVSMAGTPGPNNAMLASSGSLWGFRRTVPHMLGVSIGFPLMLIAVAGGVGHVLLHHPAILTVMRWVGAAYLFYLAWRIATAQPRVAAANLAEEERPRRRPLSFVQAALFQWVNPKAWLVTLSALATLTSVAGHPSLERALILAVVFLGATLPITAFWTSVGIGASRVLGDTQAIRRFNLLMALLLVASVAAVLAGVS